MSMKERRNNRTKSNTQRRGTDASNSRRADGSGSHENYQHKTEQKPIGQLRSSPSDGGVWSQCFETGVIVVSGYGESAQTWANQDSWEQIRVDCDDGSYYQIKLKRGTMLNNFVLHDIPEDMLTRLMRSKMEIGVRAGTAPWVVHHHNLLRDQQPKLFNSERAVRAAKESRDSSKDTNRTSILSHPEVSHFMTGFGAFDVTAARSINQPCLPQGRTGKNTRILPLYEQRRSKTLGTTQGFKMKNFELPLFEEMLLKISGSLKSPAFLNEWMRENTTDDGKLTSQQFPGFVLIGEDTPDLEDAGLSRVTWVPAPPNEESLLLKHSEAEAQDLLVQSWQQEMFRVICSHHIDGSFSATKKSDIVLLCKELNRNVGLFGVGDEPFFSPGFEKETKKALITLIDQLVELFRAETMEGTE